MLLKVLDSPASDLPSLLVWALLKAKEMLCAKCSPRVIFASCDLLFALCVRSLFFVNAYTQGTFSHAERCCGPKSLKKSNKRPKLRDFYERLYRKVRALNLGWGQCARMNIAARRSAISLLRGG